MPFCFSGARAVPGRFLFYISGRNICNNTVFDRALSARAIAKSTIYRYLQQLQNIVQ